MTDQELRDAALKVLGRIAPEADLETLDPKEDLRDQLDIDSLDVLRFATGLAEATGVEVPERDYPRIITLEGCIAYLSAALAAA